MSQSKILYNKKTSYKSKKQLKSVMIISIAVLAIVIISISIIFGNTGDNNSAAIKNNDLIILKSDITEEAKFYPVEINGTKLEVLAVKAPDNTIRTAFNTCQVCYSSGRGYYVQEGDSLVCQNCGNSFGMDDVEVTRGGCNPVPISAEDKTENDTSITISKDFLAQAKAIFNNWKN